MTHCVVRLWAGCTEDEARRIGQALQAKADYMARTPLGGSAHRQGHELVAALNSAVDKPAYLRSLYARGVRTGAGIMAIVGVVACALFAGVCVGAKGCATALPWGAIETQAEHIARPARVS